jgi:O-antigen/teichoic acid export membrane protein
MKPENRQLPDGTETDIVPALPPETHGLVGPDEPSHQPVLSGLMKKAAVWSGINSFALRLGQFSVGVVTARIIEPKQFGIFAVALTVYSIIINVNELGVSAALARTKRPVAEVAPTVATIAITSSAVFTVAMFVSAQPLATMLGAPGAAGAVRILSLIVLLGGITAVPYALLVRSRTSGSSRTARTLSRAPSSSSFLERLGSARRRWQFRRSPGSSCRWRCY